MVHERLRTPDIARAWHYQQHHVLQGISTCTLPRERTATTHMPSGPCTREIVWCHSRVNVYMPRCGPVRFGCMLLPLLQVHLCGGGGGAGEAGQQDHQAPHQPLGLLWPHCGFRVSWQHGRRAAQAYCSLVTMLLHHCIMAAAPLCGQ